MYLGPLLALLSSAALQPCEANPWASYPITIILVDDLGFDFLERSQTPNIDAIARRGVTFTQAWSYPNCSAARAALLTGRHATRTGIGSVIKWGHKDDPLLPYEETTFAELLPEPVHMFGKWHVSFRHGDPNTQGFDHYAGSLSNLNGGGSGYYDWRKTVDGVTFDETEYATKVTTDDALASGAGVRYVAYHAIHGPHDVPPGGFSTTKAGIRVQMLEYLDREIGRLLADYTGYVFLLSENTTPHELGGEKGWLTEGGVHVPFFVAGPGIAPAVSDDLVNIIDIFATLAEMRGVASTSEDSVSFLRVLRGEHGLRRTNYVETFKPNGDPTNREWAIRNRSHKLRFFRFPVPYEQLFRMPGETVVLPPYTGSDLEAYHFLRERVPFPG